MTIGGDHVGIQIYAEIKVRLISPAEWALHVAILTVDGLDNPRASGFNAAGAGSIDVRVFSVAIALLLAGCGGGTMIPGTISSERGKVLQFEIEKASRSGAAKAFDPSTGERYSGQYVAIVQSARTTSMIPNGANPIIGYGSTSSNVANASAVLTGDRGSTLTCEMNIEAGFSPHGIGQCRDQAGVSYRLQF